MKISNQTAYPAKNQPVQPDYLIGTDTEDAKNTKTFPVSGLVGLLIQYINNYLDRIISIGSITRAGNTFNIPANAVWSISGIQYTNASQYFTTISLAATGFRRTDIIVATTTGFQTITGTPSDSGISQQPPTPLGTVLVCVFDIDDNSVSNPTVPPVDPNLQTVLDNGNVAYDSTGTISRITIDLDGRLFQFTVNGGIDTGGTITASDTTVSIEFFNAEAGEAHSFAYNPDDEQIEWARDSDTGRTNVVIEKPTAEITYYYPNVQSGTYPVTAVRAADNFANDAAAAAGGIKVGQCYHSSGTVKIRLT